jgi:hypothetical protein
VSSCTPCTSPTKMVYRKPMVLQRGAPTLAFLTSSAPTAA